MCAFFSLIKNIQDTLGTFYVLGIVIELNICTISLITKPSYNIEWTLGLAKSEPRGYIIIHYMIVYSLQQGERGRKEKNRFE